MNLLWIHLIIKSFCKSVQQRSSSFLILKFQATLRNQTSLSPDVSVFHMHFLFNLNSMDADLLQKLCALLRSSCLRITTPTRRTIEVGGSPMQGGIMLFSLVADI